VEAEVEEKEEGRAKVDMEKYQAIWIIQMPRLLSLLPPTPPPPPLKITIFMR